MRVLRRRRGRAFASCRSVGIEPSPQQGHQLWPVDRLARELGGVQGVAHPLAQSKIEIELARLMTQKAAALYDAGDDLAAGEAANMAKYAAGEAACAAADRAVQAHGGNGITTEYGMAGLLVAARATRIAPVSREMILNFVGSHSLGLPKSY